MKNLRHKSNGNGYRGRWQDMRATAEAVIILLDGLTARRVVQVPSPTRHDSLEIGNNRVIGLAHARNRQVYSGPNEKEDGNEFSERS